MTLEVRKQERESTQALLRRFTKKIQQSGILLRARKLKFRKRPKSHQSQKKAALRREELRKEYAKTRKMGKPQNK